MYTIRKVSGPSDVPDFQVEEKVCLVGRYDPNAKEMPDIMLAGKGVSRKHASLFVSGGQLFVQNYGRNGTQVEGVEIDKFQLSPGDRFQIGDYLFEVEKFDGNIQETIIAGPGETGRGTLKPVSIKKKSPQKTIIAVLGVLVSVIIIAGILTQSGTDQTKPLRSGKKKTATAMREQKKEDATGIILAAENEAALGRKLFLERKISLENRFLSIGHYREAIRKASRLDTLVEKIDMWCADTAVIHHELDSLFQDHRKRSIAAFKQRKAGNSDYHLRIIMSLFPDPEDHRYLWARKNRLVLKKKR